MYWCDSIIHVAQQDINGRYTYFKLVNKRWNVCEFEMPFHSNRIIHFLSMREMIDLAMKQVDIKISLKLLKEI